MLLFRGNSTEFAAVEHLFREQTAESTDSEPEKAKPQNTGLSLALVKDALTRRDLPDQQRTLLALVYNAGDSGILTGEISAVMGLERAQLAGVRGGLGLRLKHTPGWPKGVDILVRKWDSKKKQQRFWMPAVVRQALIELGIVKGA